MAELNQNDVFSQFTVTEPSVIKPEITIPEKKEDDVFSQFQVTETTTPKKIETEPLVVSSTSRDEPSFLEKLAYGIDKQNQFFGNVLRVGKAGIEAAFDPDKDFKDAWDKIFPRKVTPKHGQSQVHRDKTKYNRKVSKTELLKDDIL